jgi:hypothetical protein
MSCNYHCFRDYIHGHEIVQTIVITTVITIVIAASQMLTLEKLPVEQASDRTCSLQRKYTVKPNSYSNPNAFLDMRHYTCPLV